MRLAKKPVPWNNLLGMLGDTDDTISTYKNWTLTTGTHHTCHSILPRLPGCAQSFIHLAVWDYLRHTQTALSNNRPRYHGFFGHSLVDREQVR